jgi:hypothetical protein
MTATGSPRALVVYESLFGNTEQVAGAVVHGLQLEGVDAGLVEAGSAPSILAEGLDLLVVGGPTHGFTMSRGTTREDAVRQGAASERARTGIREWLESVQIDPEHLPLVATFDTRVAKVRWIPQAAGPAATRLARRRGLHPILRPAGFLVDDTRGPLVGGELDQAVSWGRRLAVTLVNRIAAEVRPTRGG